MPRTPAPAALRLLSGRSEGRDSGGRKVAPPAGFRRMPPRMPSTLSPAAKRVWARVTPELARLELLKPEDADSLAVYCEAVVTFREATKQVRRDGAVVTNRSVRKDGTESEWQTKNPAVSVADMAAKQIRAFGAEFGLTPASESKLSVREPLDDDENPFA
jgi:P27 family predicted phage terminase small subunit